MTTTDNTQAMEHDKHGDWWYQAPQAPSHFESLLFKPCKGMQACKMTRNRQQRLWCCGQHCFLFQSGLDSNFSFRQFLAPSHLSAWVFHVDSMSLSPVNSCCTVQSPCSICCTFRRSFSQACPRFIFESSVLSCPSLQNASRSLTPAEPLVSVCWPLDQVGPT